MTGGCVKVAGNPGVAAGPDDGARLIAGPDGVGTSGMFPGGIGGGRSVKNCALAVFIDQAMPSNTSVVACRDLRRLEVWLVFTAFIARFFTENAANSSLRTWLTQ